MVSGGRHHNLADTPACALSGAGAGDAAPGAGAGAGIPPWGCLPRWRRGAARGKEARSGPRRPERLGLAGREGAFVHQLSGGMAQRAPLPPPPWGGPSAGADEPTKGSTAGPQPGWVPCCWATWPVDAIC